MSIPSRFKRSAGEQPGGADSPKQIKVMLPGGEVKFYRGDMIEIDNDGNVIITTEQMGCSAIFDLRANTAREFDPLLPLTIVRPRKNWFQKLFGL